MGLTLIYLQQLYSITPHKIKETVTVAKANLVIETATSALAKIREHISESLSEEYRENKIKQYMVEKLGRNSAETQFNNFIKSMEKERDEIIKNMLTMAIFCNESAIIPYNNDCIDQVELEFAIRQYIREFGEPIKVEELKKIKDIQQDIVVVCRFTNYTKTKNSTTISDVTEAFYNLSELPACDEKIRELHDAITPDSQDENPRNLVRLNVDIVL